MPVLTKKFNNESFLHDLKQLNWDSIQDTDDPNVAWDMFISLFKPICDIHAPF